MEKQYINDKEHILVCLSSAPSNPKIIQTAAAMAKKSGAEAADDVKAGEDNAVQR